MITIEIKEAPEELRQRLRQLRTHLLDNDQFDGLFRKGKIDGRYFSNFLHKSRRTFSHVRVKGVYDIAEGTLSLEVKKSNYFYIVILGFVLFALASSYMTYSDDTVPNILMLVPICMAAFAVIVNIFIYCRNNREFRRLFYTYFDPLEIAS